MASPRHLRALAAAAAPAVFIFLWSTAFIAARAGLPYTSPVFFLAVRFVIAAGVLGLLVLILRQGEPWRSGPIGHLVLAGVLMNALYLSGAYIAMESITAATMALIGAFHPLVTALLADRLLGERMSRLQWLGLAIGLAGAALAIGPGAAAGGTAAGMAFGAGGVACLGIGTIYHRRFCRNVAPITANWVQLSAAAIFCLAAAPLVEDVELAATATLLAALLYLALVVSVGAMALFIFMLRRGTAGQVSSNFYLTPGTTAVLGWLVLGEALGWVQVAGFALAMLGVRLANLRG